MHKEHPQPGIYLLKEDGEWFRDCFPHYSIVGYVDADFLDTAIAWKNRIPNLHTAREIEFVSDMDFDNLYHK